MTEIIAKKDIANPLSHSIPAQKVSTLIMNEPSARKAGLDRTLQTPPTGDNIASSPPGGILMNHKKIKNIRAIKSIVARLRARRKKVVFTNGCFDILHVGHIHYLRKARSLGDILVVGLNTDRSVRQIKGEKRPIVPQKDRAEVLAALEFVDYVVLFDEPDPFSLIQKVKPTILVKGADWPKDKIIGRDVVEKTGGRVVRIPLVPGASSTGVIETIIQVYCNKLRADRPKGP
jgi:D-beta-D-heptose 7-phosphate kinase/D-beta-D-heptose 1-phosphate adenosyltransferase